MAITMVFNKKKEKEEKGTPSVEAREVRLVRIRTFIVQ